MRSSLSSETAYRFKHVLIRDVAYSRLTKSARAGHHARFASGSASERATSCSRSARTTSTTRRRSLPTSTARRRPTSRERLPRSSQEAGRRALAREANQAARNSFLRAVELEPTLERRYLAAKAAWRLDDLPAVAREMDKVREEAVRAGDRPSKERL